MKWDVLWLTDIGALGSLWDGSCALTSRPQARRAQVGAKRRSVRPMNAQDLLQEIGAYGRHSGLADSPLAGRAATDGKLPARLRNGARTPPETLARTRGFREPTRPGVARPAVIERAREPRPAA